MQYYLKRNTCFAKELKLLFLHTANHFTQNARPECTVPVKVSLNLSLLAATFVVC